MLVLSVQHSDSKCLWVILHLSIIGRYTTSWLLFFSRNILGTFWWFSGWESALSTQGMWVWSLAEELRFCMLQGTLPKLDKAWAPQWRPSAAKKNKKKEKEIFLIFLFIYFSNWIPEFACLVFFLILFVFLLELRSKYRVFLENWRFYDVVSS